MAMTHDPYLTQRAGFVMSLLEMEMLLSPSTLPVRHTVECCQMLHDLESTAESAWCPPGGNAGCRKQKKEAKEGREEV
jgi:hypothetical protein